MFISFVPFSNVVSYFSRNVQLDKIFVFIWCDML